MQNNFQVMCMLWHIEKYWIAYSTLGIFLFDLLLAALILQNMTTQPQQMILSTNWSNVDCISPTTIATHMHK